MQLFCPISESAKFHLKKSHYGRREFQFPIDFSADRHHILTSSHSRVITYARDRIYNNKLSGAVDGTFNGNVIIRDLGLKDSATVIHEQSIKELQPNDLQVFPLPVSNLLVDLTKNTVLFRRSRSASTF